MMIKQAQELHLDNQTGTIVIPYLKKEDVTIEWLKGLLPANTVISEGLNPHIKIENSWMPIQLLFIKQEKATPREDLKEAFGAFGNNIKTHCQILLDHLTIEGLSKEDLVWLGTQAILEGVYAFNKAVLKEVTGQTIFKMRDRLGKKEEAFSVIFISKNDYTKEIEKGIVYGQAINGARTISNLPNNYLHTSDFATYANDLGEFYGLKTEVLGDAQLEKLHSGGILSVNAGSDQEANLISLTYKGDPDSNELNGVIGKGVMFDTGGYHLKAMDGMDGMKYDMCGAASVLGVIEIAAALKIKTNLMVVVPAVENLISEKATRMGDVITTMSGQTVEVYNTDAEGRLILCDALTYAREQGATKLIDLATLTYSCQGALGDEICGIFSNDETFYKTFIKATEKAGEKVWRLPLDPIYHKLIRQTKTADLINYAPGYAAGASVAACFLESFIEKDMPWIHLDIVGPAVARSEKPHKEKGATGVLITSIASLLES